MPNAGGPFSIYSAMYAQGLALVRAGRSELVQELDRDLARRHTGLELLVSSLALQDARDRMPPRTKVDVLNSVLAATRRAVRKD